MMIKFIEPEVLYEMRHKVLRPNLPFSDVKYDTDYHPESFHIGAYEENELIGIASFNLEQCEEFCGEGHYRLRAMAVLPSHRRCGVGSALIHRGEDILRSRSAEVLWCKGRVHVQEYYEKIGFQPYGKVFDYPTLGPHIIMMKTLEV